MRWDEAPFMMQMITTSFARRQLPPASSGTQRDCMPGSRQLSRRRRTPRGARSEGLVRDGRALCHQGFGYTTTSIRRGPRLFMAPANRRANSSTDVARLASTPMPEASLTQSSSGLCRSSIERPRSGSAGSDSRKLNIEDQQGLGTSSTGDQIALRHHLDERCRSANQNQGRAKC
jgi:hypothetical protein